MEKRTPKSPVPRSPLPKSPMPKSPVLYEKYKSRCAYGLISFFHFRQSHSKKLISDSRRLKRHAVDDGNIRNRLDLLPSIDKKRQRTNDRVEHQTVTVESRTAEVEKIMGKDVSTKQQMKKKISTAKVEHIKSDSQLAGDLSGNHIKANKTSRRPRRLPIYGCYDVATVGRLVDGSSEKDSAVTSEALSNFMHDKNGRGCNCKSTNCVRYDHLNEINLQVHMNEAVEAFVNQKLTDGKHVSGGGASHQSKHFLDALEVLNSNKDLFIKLLQDPNSLLVKHIEDLQGSQAKKEQDRSLTESDSSEHPTSNAREYEVPIYTQNFKSSDGYLSEAIGDPQPLDKIVVLRPGPTSLHNCDRTSDGSPKFHYSLRNVQQSVRPAFFPFDRIKKRLLHAIGVSRNKQQLMPVDSEVHKPTHHFHGFERFGQGTGVEIVEKKSPEKESFAFRGIRKDHMDKATEFESVVAEEAASAFESVHHNLNSSIVRHPKQNKYDKYTETRIDLSELNNRNESFFRNQRPKMWDGISFVPEYDFLPTVSSGNKKELGFVTPQMKFSPYGNHQKASKNKQKNQRDKNNICLSPLTQNAEALLWADNKKHYDQLQMAEKKPSISDKHFPEVKVHESISSLNINLNPRGSMKIAETKDSKHLEEINACEVHSKPDGSRNNGANQSTDTAVTCRGDESSDFSGVDSSAENQTSSSSTDYSSSPSSVQRVEDIDRIKDLADQPSPVSVFEQFFMEQAISPLSTEIEPAESSVLSLPNDINEAHFAALNQFSMDLKINSSTLTDKHRSMLQYVGTVLLASGIEWDKLSLKCHSSDQLLDQSLIDEVNVWPNQSCGDERLLFDYLNEVLLEVYQCYLRSSPLVSFIKGKILPVIMPENVAHEVMKHVDWSLIFQPPPQTLDQLVENDMANSETWMDIRIDAEYIVCEMVDRMIEELITESALE